MGSQPVLDPPEPPKETVVEVSEAEEEESTTNLNSKLVLVLGASKTVAGKSQASCGAAKCSGYDGSIVPEIEKLAEQEQLPNFVSACGVEEIQTESCHYRPEAEADQVRLLRNRSESSSTTTAGAAACLPEPATAPDPMPAVAAPDVDLPVEEEGGEEKAYILDGRGVCYDPGRFSELM